MECSHAKAILCVRLTIFWDAMYRAINKKIHVPRKTLNQAKLPSSLANLFGRTNQLLEIYRTFNVSQVFNFASDCFTGNINTVLISWAPTVFRFSSKSNRDFLSG